MRLISQKMWMTENATGFGVQFYRTLFTTAIPAGVQLTYQPLQLTKLFDDPYTPLNTVAWVNTAEEFVQASVRVWSD
jgi:hypothetical protein